MARVNLYFPPIVPVSKFIVLQNLPPDGLPRWLGSQGCMYIHIYMNMCSPGYMYIYIYMNTIIWFRVEWGVFVFLFRRCFPIASLLQVLTLPLTFWRAVYFSSVSSSPPLDFYLFLFPILFVFPVQSPQKERKRSNAECLCDNSNDILHPLFDENPIPDVIQWSW